MPDYLTPGVYLEQIERGPPPIVGVPTSTAAFLGEAERGTIKPRLVTSYQEFERWFGGTLGADKFLPCAVSGFFENGGKRLFVCRVVGEQATYAQATFGNLIVRASGPGSWGRRVWARVDDSTTTKPDAAGNPVPVGFRLRLAYWSNAAATFQPFDPFAEAAKLPRPALSEDFDDLVTDGGSPDFYERRMRDSSALATLTSDVEALNGSPCKGSAALAHGGVDGPGDLNDADYRGELVPDAPRTELRGLAALEADPYFEVALVYAPGVDVAVAKAIITHCQRLDRFAVIDSCKGDDASSLDPRTKIQDSAYAAFYYPWVVISDVQTGARRTVPPGGHALGVYARTDVERGVFKVPAGTILRGAIELEIDIGDDAAGVLNARGVNVIRQFPGHGIVVRGARTIASDAPWKYVTVRRLFIFFERSIYEGTQWVVFEPNNPHLWGQVTASICMFLRSQWQLGALVGRTEEQAFFVTCDETTMTQDDILNGRLICEIGIAPLRPAEFVVFHLFQRTSEAR